MWALIPLRDVTNVIIEFLRSKAHVNLKKQKKALSCKRKLTQAEHGGKQEKDVHEREDVRIHGSEWLLSETCSLSWEMYVASACLRRGQRREGNRYKI